MLKCGSRVRLQPAFVQMLIVMEILGKNQSHITYGTVICPVGPRRYLIRVDGHTQTIIVPEDQLMSLSKVVPVDPENKPLAGPELYKLAEKQDKETDWTDSLLEKLEGIESLLDSNMGQPDSERIRELADKLYLDLLDVAKQAEKEEKDRQQRSLEFRYQALEKFFKDTPYPDSHFRRIRKKGASTEDLELVITTDRKSGQGAVIQTKGPSCTLIISLLEQLNNARKSTS